MTTTTLYYRPGVAMSSDVRRFDGDERTLSIEMLRNELLSGNAIQCVYEPGDVTRYDLVLTPLRSGGGGLGAQRGLLVTRMAGGRVIGTALLWDWNFGASPFQIADAASALSHGYEWCTILFGWWLTRLCERTESDRIEDSYAPTGA